MITDDLVNDLWWFIENCTDDAPDRQDRFFALRARVQARTRAGPLNVGVVLRDGVVQQVFSNHEAPAVTLWLYDFDCEGEDNANRLTMTATDDGDWQPAYVTRYGPTGDESANFSDRKAHNAAHFQFQALAMPGLARAIEDDDAKYAFSPDPSDLAPERGAMAGEA